MNDLKKRRMATVWGETASTRTNLELCMRLIAEGKLRVDPLTTHAIPLENVEKEVERILGEPDRIPGVVFRCR